MKSYTIDDKDPSKVWVTNNETLQVDGPFHSTQAAQDWIDDQIADAEDQF
jgi:hypothetical protein